MRFQELQDMVCWRNHDIRTLWIQSCLPLFGQLGRFLHGSDWLEIIQQGKSGYFQCIEQTWTWFRRCLSQKYISVWYIHMKLFNTSQVLVQWQQIHIHSLQIIRSLDILAKKHMWCWFSVLSTGTSPYPTKWEKEHHRLKLLLKGDMWSFPARYHQAEFQVDLLFFMPFLGASCYRIPNLSPV